VRGYVATTDFDWFHFLRARQPLDEVNFWQPSAHGFNAPPGTPFFFKLKAPYNAIGGFGIFARYEPAEPRLAWDAFGEKNGAASFEQMWQRISQYAKGGQGHRVGCIMVSQPLFFDDADWVAQPNNWQRQVVSGAGYDLTAGEGLRIWQECQARAMRIALDPKVEDGLGQPLAAEPSQAYGRPQLVLPRLGQGTFRVSVTSAYGGACAVTGEHSLPVLEAAHIQPYSVAGSHAVPNGLLLRADIHRLFDAGYVTVTPDYRFEVSGRLAQEWENGKVYYALQGRPIEVPKRPADRPGADLLQWHNENVFEKPAA
jgi:putative restriction endonuclease